MTKNGICLNDAPEIWAYCVATVERSYRSR